MSRQGIGFALGLIAVGATLLYGAMLVTVFERPWVILLGEIDTRAESEAAQSGHETLTLAVDAAPVIGVFLVLIMLLAMAAARGGRV